MLTYAIWPLDDNGQPAFSRRPDPDGRWRGRQALPAPPTNETMRGTLVEHLLDSSYLGEARPVTVYLPPAHSASAGPYPVVYATDGQFFAPYARRVDAAIEAGTIPPLVIVAAHAAGFDPSRGGNLRAMEYLLGFDPRRYESHERFFVTELARWAETEFAVIDRAGPAGGVRLFRWWRPRDDHRRVPRRALRPCARLLGRHPAAG